LIQTLLNVGVYPLTKGVENSKKRAKNKILLKTLIQKQQSVDTSPD